MRCYFLVLLVACVACFLAFHLLLHSSPSREISLVRPVIFAKPWSLAARNHARLHRLYAQYGSLVNLSALQTMSLSNKTMIYSCRSFCGGWGDRLRGILSVYVLALLTDRRFLIDMTYPCDLLQVVQPNAVNWTWTEPSRQANRSQLIINTMASWRAAYQVEIATMIKSKDIVKDWSNYDDIFLSTNRDYMTPALRNPHLYNRTRRLFAALPMSQASLTGLFALLFELLFQPSLAVRQRVDTILAASNRHELICLHVRVGKNPTNPFDHAFTERANTTSAMIQFVDLNLTNATSPLIFITSDNGQAVSDVLHRYPNSSMTIVGPILHIDRFDRRSTVVRDGFVKVLADFYLLGECQISLLSASGFSSWANRRREQPSANLYIYDERRKQMIKG